MGLGTGGKCGNLLVADMNPLDLALAAQGVGQPIEAVADDAVNPFHPGRRENFGKLIRDRLCHDFLLFHMIRLLTEPPAGAWEFNA
jgi:hypothetical protein